MLKQLFLSLDISQVTSLRNAAKLKSNSYSKITNPLHFVIVLQEITTKYLEHNSPTIVHTFAMGTK